MRATRYLGLFLGFIGLLWLGPSTAAQARTVHYDGPHPISPRVGKGMCWIEAPHVHAYAPHKALLYVRAGRSYVFVGDPVEFEKAAPSYAYYGHHPVFWTHPGRKRGRKHKRYCYIVGPHHHWYPPPPAVRAKYKKRGGVLWYVAPHPKHYRRKHWRARALHRHYHRVHLARPEVEVKPPPGWVGFVIEGPQGKVRLHGPPGRIKGKHRIGSWIWAGVEVKGHGPHGKVKVHGPHGKVKVHMPMGLFGVKIHGPHGKVKVKGPHGKIKVKGPMGMFKVKGPGFKVKVKGGMGHHRHRPHRRHHRRGRHKHKGMR